MIARKTATLRTLTLVAAALGLVLPEVVLADGDPAVGERSFRKCQACHEIGDDAVAKVGPPLTGIIGRAAGSIEGFAYSDAMHTAAEGGLVWSEEELDKFLAKPREVIAGTKMTFAGIRNEQERADLIAYLATFPAQ
jgi:cytochrome c